MRAGHPSLSIQGGRPLHRGVPSSPSPPPGRLAAGGRGPRQEVALFLEPRLRETQDAKVSIVRLAAGGWGRQGARGQTLLGDTAQSGTAPTGQEARIARPAPLSLERSMPGTFSRKSSPLCILCLCSLSLGVMTAGHRPDLLSPHLAGRSQEGLWRSTPTPLSNPSCRKAQGSLRTPRGWVGSAPCPLDLGPASICS